MARPSKAVASKTGVISKGELERRAAQEERLRGGGDQIQPPDYLTGPQKEIFNAIVAEYQDIGILGNLDIYVLSQGSIVIDRLREMESQINRQPELLSDSRYMATKERYSKEFWRFCNELSLSPQSRAKLANTAVKLQKDEMHPTIAALAVGGFGL